MWIASEFAVKAKRSHKLRKIMPRIGCDMVEVQILQTFCSLRICIVQDPLTAGSVGAVPVERHQILTDGFGFTATVREQPESRWLSAWS